MDADSTKAATPATVGSARKGPNLTEDSIGRLMAQLAIPSGIGFMFATLYNLVDTFWANRLGQVIGSSDPVDALGVGSGYFFLMLAVAIGLNQGSTAMMSNALGRGDMAAARTSFFQTLGLGAVTSVLLALVGLWGIGLILESRFADRPDMVSLALDYLVPVYICAFSFIFSLAANSALASQGDFATVGVVQVIAFVLNCIFDPLFMFGWGPIPGFGIMGLAIATVTINVVGLMIIFYRTANSRLFDGFKLSELGLDLTGSGDLIRQCVPATLNMAIIGAGYIVITEILNGFGSGAIGGFSNASRIEQLILLPVIGLQIAVLTIIGQNMGAQKYDRVKRAFVLGVRIALIIMGVGMLLVWLLHDLASSQFAAGNQDIRAMSNLYLLYSSSALFAYALVLVCGGVLQGMKRPIMPMVINILRLIIGPYIAFTIASTAFDMPNIHVGWIGSMAVAWACGLFSLAYVWHQIQRLQ